METLADALQARSCAYRLLAFFSQMHAAAQTPVYRALGRLGIALARTEQPAFA